ncbi:hypothetical protein [Halorarius halobius]|uniref:hypothetical protein n=1 Tax=Halorarius halobius TaxID=2962671 RepID=UPI0020CE0DE6|nr:hypothetical protein [Halorarius halobius]
MVPDSTTPSRRSLLAAVGAGVTAATAGCNGLSSREGEGDTHEIILTNQTGEFANVAVRVTDADGAALFSRVYELGPGKADESAGVETRPATVKAFTPDGTTAAWAFDPDLDCEGPDVGIRLTDDGFEEWYGC